MKHKLATVVLMGLLLFYGYIVVTHYYYIAQSCETMCIALIPEFVMVLLASLLLKPRIPALAVVLALLLVTRLVVKAMLPDLGLYIFTRLIGEIAAGEFFLLWYLWRKY